MDITVTLLCLVAYIVGMILLVRVTPALVKRAFDDAFFVAVAGVAIFGVMLAFGAVGVTYSLFSGSLGARSLDVFLLLILLIVALRTSLGAFRPRYGIGVGSYRLSRIMAGSFFLLVTVAALCLLVLMFVPE